MAAQPARLELSSRACREVLCGEFSVLVGRTDRNAPFVHGLENQGGGARGGR